MTRFITDTLVLAAVIALAGALYFVVGAYNMPFSDQVLCHIDLDNSATCQTVQLLDKYTR